MDTDFGCLKGLSKLVQVLFIWNRSSYGADFDNSEVPAL